MTPVHSSNSNIGRDGGIVGGGPVLHGEQEHLGLPCLGLDAMGSGEPLARNIDHRQLYLVLSSLAKAPCKVVEVVEKTKASSLESISKVLYKTSFTDTQGS